MDGLGGSFTVLQRVGGAEGECPDWLIIEANARVREVYGPMCGDPVGQLVSDLDRFANNAGSRQTYAAALEPGTRPEADLGLNLPNGVSTARPPLAVPSDHQPTPRRTCDIQPAHEPRPQVAAPPW